MLSRNAAALLAALCATCLTPARAAIDLQSEPGKLPAITSDGQPTGAAPLRLIVQEWKKRGPRASSASPSSNAPRNTVGSIIEAGEVLGAGLDPLNPAWDETPEIRAALVRKGGWSATLAYPREIEADIEIDRVAANHIVVKGNVRNLSRDPANAERPLTLSVAVPFEFPEPLWHNDNHRTQSASGPDELIETVTTTGGARGAMSRYPFAVMTSGARSLAVGLPLDQPRVHRVRWDGARRALIAEIDVALSAIPEAFPNRVPFEFHLFDFNAAWGFRGATQVYHAMNADSFAVRVRKHGQWMPFTQIDKVQRPEDFGFAYHEYHPDVSVAYDNANGILPLVYCEPICQYVNISRDAPKTDAFLRDTVAALATRQGSQVRTSSTLNDAGAMQSAWVETPWAIGARIPTNSSPRVATTAEDLINSFHANWLPYSELYRRRAADKPLAWETGAQIVEGVPGATGRALELPAGASASAVTPLAASPDVASKAVAGRVRASAMPGAKLELVIGEGDPIEIAPGEFATSFDVAAKPGAPKGGTVKVLVRASAGTVWIDEISFPGLEIPNAGFDQGVGDPEAVGGLYIDSFEGWDAKDLNFRTDHLAKTTLPLTFDATTGRTAQVIMLHNFEFAAEARQRLRERGAYLMGNTALYQWAWSTHYLDVLGIETSWGESETIVPPRIAEMDYLRTMLGQKPYCYLQNTRYDRFRGQKIEDYFARCFHYGLWPGFFSHNAAESPYWHDPSLYNADRPVFLRYTAPQQRLAELGWQPVTLAVASNPRVLVERWGGGPITTPSPLRPAEFGLTLHNPGTQEEVAIALLQESLGTGRDYLALDLIGGGLAPRDPSGEGVEVELAPLATRAIWFVRRDVAALAPARESTAREVQSLLAKYKRHYPAVQPLQGVVSLSANDNSPQVLVHAASIARPLVEPVYHEELDRAVTNLRLLATAEENARAARTVAPGFPPSVIPGSDLVITFPAPPSTKLVAELRIGSETTAVPVEGSAIRIPVPADLIEGSRIRAVVRPAGAADAIPYYEVPLEARPLVSIMDAPERLVLSTSTEMQIRLRANTAAPLAGRLIVTLPGELEPVESRAMELQPAQAMTAPIPLAIKPGLRAETTGRASIRFLAADGRSAEHAPQLTLLGPGASLLRDSRVQVRTDSFYFGYGPEPLNDGITDTASLGWKNAAWASEEALTAHWAEFEFADVAELREVIVHWALDGGRRWTSRNVEVQVREPGSSNWRTVGQAGAPAPTEFTRVTFPPAKVARLRVFQPAGGGPADRQGILWLSEVEAR